MLNIFITSAILLICIIVFIYNKKIFQKQVVKKLTGLVRAQLQEKLDASGTRNEEERAQIVIAYLRELENKVKQDNKKGRMIEFKKMVENLYGEGFIKKRENLKKYMDGLDSRFGL